ncbi:MAG: MoaD/ThiS family protein [Candidatus Bathyarchaeia archaeon]
MPLMLKFIGALRQISGKTQLTVNFQEGMSIQDLVTKISQEMPRLDKTFSDQLNDSRSNSLILINGREISVLNGLETKLNDGDEIVFIPVVHGG